MASSVSTINQASDRGYNIQGAARSKELAHKAHSTFDDYGSQFSGAVISELFRRELYS
ncbi:uncharacterized protein TrAFT101_009256 [Trichoderma asperellum]|uniref:uncharacterized protein n=1 Tax=Trichoderma asperellum TaxID=101201 RepID=UPI00332042C3|nr:hypothetical protein TrAFT101_009256 [Trichoderma asperellum]